MRANDPRMVNGNNPNPMDIPTTIPREHWSESEMERREQQLETSKWYPHADGPPETIIPPRFDAFKADRTELSANISPQKWDVTNLNVPQSGIGVNPVEIFPFMMNRASVTVTNTGSNTLIISPTIEKAMAGVGVSVPSGEEFQVDTQGGGWAYASGGSGIAQIMWTAWESPTTHQPPKSN